MFDIKLLTLNTHSIIEPDYEKKLEFFVEAIERERPDIIALQEVNQLINSDKADKNLLIGYYSCNSTIPVRSDNHAYRVVNLLNEKGINYNWTWLGIKKGYDKYDEGLALLSLEPITETKAVRLSETHDYENWKTRKALGIKVNDEWYYSVHFSWWNDKDEPFLMQWARMMKATEGTENVWLMGDFNNSAEAKNEGYDVMRNFGWYDTFSLAAKKDSGYTVENIIDGWKERLNKPEKLRIDFIMSKKTKYISSSHTIFNGINEPVVSDHYGVICEL